MPEGTVWAQAAGTSGGGASRPGAGSQAVSALEMAVTGEQQK